jgi:hypothetical protein
VFSGNPDKSGFAAHLSPCLSKTSNGIVFAPYITGFGRDMTLKIERFSGKRGTRIRLSGELRSEQLDDLCAEIERGGPRVTMDLHEVDLVDIDAVRFLNICEAQDVEVVNCSAYIREWMFQERERERNSERS